MQIEIGSNIRQPTGFNAFIAYPFPPSCGFNFSANILKKNDKATRLLGKLDGITKLLPDSNYFLLMGKKLGRYQISHRNFGFS